MHRDRFIKVIIQKPDLDTCLTGLILGIGSDDNIITISHDANDSDLYNPKVLCIECGGSGLVEFNNFDHHDPNKYLPPACRQAYEHLQLNNRGLLMLIDFVCMVDERKPFVDSPQFPSLSNLFSGMLLVEDNKSLQFIKGMEILNYVLTQGIDPFGTMPLLDTWQGYIQAKLDNQRRLSESLKDIKTYRSSSGLNIGFLQTDSIGGIEAIYTMGCDVALLYSPNYGNPPHVKYTIASKEKAIGHLINILSALEKGWGGRATIIGSPRSGTTMKIEDVLSILIDNL